MKRLVIENKLATLGYYHIHVFNGNVMDNYTDTPPMKRELNKVIRAAHRGEAA